MTFENTFYLLSLSLLIVCSEYFFFVFLAARDFYLSNHLCQEEGVMPWWGPAGRCFAVSLLSGVVCIPTVFNFWRFVAALNGLLAVIVAGCVDEAPFVRCCSRQTIRIRIFVSVSESTSTSTHPNPHPHPSTTRSCQQLFLLVFTVSVSVVVIVFVFVFLFSPRGTSHPQFYCQYRCSCCFLLLLLLLLLALFVLLLLLFKHKFA